MAKKMEELAKMAPPNLHLLLSLPTGASTLCTKRKRAMWNARSVSWSVRWLSAYRVQRALTFGYFTSMQPWLLQPLHLALRSLTTS